MLVSEVCLADLSTLGIFESWLSYIFRFRFPLRIIIDLASEKILCTLASILQEGP